jgi:uncharacterized protein YjbJ (UPF0337 family)
MPNAQCKFQYATLTIAASRSLPGPGDRTSLSTRLTKPILDSAIMMTNEEIQGSWNHLVGEIQKQYANITGDELSAVKGNANQLVSLIQRKTGGAKQDIEAFIDKAAAGASRSVDRIADVAMRYADSAGEAVKDGYSKVQDASAETYQAAGRMVKKSPVESMLVAFGIGMVAGLFAGASLFGRRA